MVWGLRVNQFLLRSTSFHLGNPNNLECTYLKSRSSRFCSLFIIECMSRKGNPPLDIFFELLCILWRFCLMDRDKGSVSFCKGLSSVAAWNYSLFLRMAFMKENTKNFSPRFDGTLYILYVVLLSPLERRHVDVCWIAWCICLPSFLDNLSLWDNWWSKIVSVRALVMQN